MKKVICLVLGSVFLSCANADETPSLSEVLSGGHGYNDYTTPSTANDGLSEIGYHTYYNEYTLAKTGIGYKVDFYFYDENDGTTFIEDLHYNCRKQKVHKGDAVWVNGENQVVKSVSIQKEYKLTDKKNVGTMVYKLGKQLCSQY